MQIVSWDNLREKSDFVFWEKQENIFKKVVSDFFTQHAKSY